MTTTTDTPTKPKRKSRAKSAGTMRTADLSKLTKVRMKKAATRVNTTQPLTHINYKSDKAPKEVRGKAPWAPRPRLENEATGPVNDLWQREVYRTGDGDTVVPVRPGSLDFLNWPSRGNRT